MKLQLRQKAIEKNLNDSNSPRCVWGYIYRFKDRKGVGAPFLNGSSLNRNYIIGAGTLLTLTNLKLYSLAIA